MRTSHRIASLLLGVLLTLGGTALLKHAKAQTVAPPITIQATVAHTSCAVVASVTSYCFASDGLFVSLNGAAYAAVPLSSVSGGVTSVTVCNAAGTGCGTPQTGSVSLNIPKTVTISAPVASVSTGTIGSGTTLGQLSLPTVTVAAPTGTLN